VQVGKMDDPESVERRGETIEEDPVSTNPDESGFKIGIQENQQGKPQHRLILTATRNEIVCTKWFEASFRGLRSDF
jgi:hypothetical protein